MRHATNYKFQKPSVLQNNITPIEPWFDIRQVSHVSQLSSEYQHLCQKHDCSKKWILMIDAERQSLKNVNHAQFDQSKVLLVNSNKVKIDLAAIEKALSSGNCSAVILCDSIFEEKQIAQLRESARKGKTKCILLNRSNALH